MTEKESSKPVVAQIHEIGLWIENLNNNDELEIVDRTVIKEVFESFGANFSELLEVDKENLSKYKNSDRAGAMRKIWGDKYDDFKKWSSEWADNWEEKNHAKLPTIRQESKKEPGKVLIFKNSGMIQFLGTLTALAGLNEEEYPFEEVKRLTESRAKNGRAWAEGRKKDRDRVEVPTSKNKKLLSSYPPGFPQEAWNFLKEKEK